MTSSFTNSKPLVINFPRLLVKVVWQWGGGGVLTLLGWWDMYFGGKVLAIMGMSTSAGILTYFRGISQREVVGNNIVGWRLNDTSTKEGIVGVSGSIFGSPLPAP